MARRLLLLAALHLTTTASLTFGRGAGPKCDQVWLALEAKGVAYATERRDDDAPVVRWDDGSETAGPLPIMERLDKECDAGARLFVKPRAGIDRVRDTNLRFRPIFPRNTRDSVGAPFMYKEDGSLTSLDSIRVTLEETDELLEENAEGDFFAGDALTAVDCAWAPYLARMAVQVPLLHGHYARSAEEYPALHRWFEAVEAELPCVGPWLDDMAAAWRDALDEPPGGFLATIEDVAREAGRAVVEIDPWREGSPKKASKAQIADLTRGLF